MCARVFAAVVLGGFLFFDQPPRVVGLEVGEDHAGPVGIFGLLLVSALEGPLFEDVESGPPSILVFELVELL